MNTKQVKWERQLGDTIKGFLHMYEVLVRAYDFDGRPTYVLRREDGAEVTARQDELHLLF